MERKRIIRKNVKNELFEVGTVKIENAVFEGIEHEDIDEVNKIIARCLHKYTRGEWDNLTEADQEHNRRQIARNGIINVRYRTEVGTLRIMTSDDRIETLVKMA